LVDILSQGERAILGAEPRRQLKFRVQHEPEILWLYVSLL
jgi:hypothetical protein